MGHRASHLLSDCHARAEKDAARRRQRSGEQAEFVRGDKTTPRAMEADYSAAQAANDNSATRSKDRERDRGRGDD